MRAPDSLENPHDPHASKALARPRLRALLREQQSVHRHPAHPSEYATVSQIHTIHMLLKLQRARGLGPFLVSSSCTPKLVKVGFNILPLRICDSLANPHIPHAFKALTRPRLRALLREQQFGSQVHFNIPTPSEHATVSQIHTIHMLLMV